MPEKKDKKIPDKIEAKVTEKIETKKVEKIETKVPEKIETAVTEEKEVVSPETEVKEVEEVKEEKKAKKRGRPPKKADEKKADEKNTDEKKPVRKRTKKEDSEKESTTEVKKKTTRTIKTTKKEVNSASSQINHIIAAPAKRGRKKKEENAKAVKKILFVGSEVLPYAATGGLGEVLGSLPKALAKRGDYDVRVIMPYYKEIIERYGSEVKYLCNYNVGLAWRNLYCGLFTLEKDNVTYYFIDNEYYFRRDTLYGFYDDGERYAFFSKAVMDSIYFTGFMPDIIHANDWQSALVPIYNTCIYRYDLKTIFTIHNIEYQGKYDLAILGDVFGLPPEAGAYVEYDGCINLLKGAIECSDCVTTVSESYANELHDASFAHGLEKIIAKNAWKTRGILNGLDTTVYNAETDGEISNNFSPVDVTGKLKDKRELQEMGNLYADDNAPLLALVTRLVSHKGMDIVMDSLEGLLNNTNLQVIILGKGDRRYEDYFLWLQNQYRGRVSAMITYNKALSHKVYAGSDMFLMPSKAEPCGLSQMIACRYGTVPIVRETGGLRDSIKDCGGGEGNGFTFSNYSAADLSNAVYRAVDLYRNHGDDWDKLRKYIMTIDFSWSKSAEKYDEMYSWITGIQ